MDHVVVAAYNTTNFYIGQFGVSPNPTYFTVTNDNSSALDDPVSISNKIIAINTII